MVNRHGVTILELLIALALIAALFALVLPFAVTQLSERAFLSTAEQVRAHMLVARAEAMHSRTPLEVRYRLGESGGVVEIVPFTAAMRSVTSGEFRQAAAREDETDALDLSFDDGFGDSTQSTIESWRVLELGSDTRLLNSLPDEFDLNRLDGESLDLSSDELDLVFDDLTYGSEFAPGVDETEVVRLVAYLPDGSAIVSHPAWLVDEDGRRMKLSVNPWTGMPTFERTASESEIEDELSADEESEDESRLDSYTDEPAEDLGSSTLDEGGGGS